MNLVSLSENTLLVLFEQNISRDVFRELMSQLGNIEQHLSEHIIEITPAYASIHIHFNLTTIRHEQFKARLAQVLKNHSPATQGSVNEKLISIPVYYGEEVALDLAFVAQSAGISKEEVIRRHSNKIYDVYAMGFAPGFAYLGLVDECIATPRKATPRQRVAAGSLAIADQQTAVYPSDSPGGWQLIGKTPQQLVDYDSDYLTLFEVGNRVKFSPITRDEFLQLGGVLPCP